MFTLDVIGQTFELSHVPRDLAASFRLVSKNGLRFRVHEFRARSIVKSGTPNISGRMQGFPSAYSHTAVCQSVRLSYV